MYKRILVAIDGSATSERALKEALKLAKNSGGQLRIVHVVDLAGMIYPEYIGPSSDIWASLLKQGHELLDGARRAAANAGVPAEISQLENSTPGNRVAQLIVQEADAWPADLLVAGTHGRRGTSRVFLGSVAEQIARISNKPLLLIRSE
ncbi:universal stress protein [Noviherbaspirillum pedocola]|uniref:Universal stress protein n=1 Tax=Noviherbaspirillum pedocola TaxID=2801341 RepID=A0A934T2T0_9BURK|nr:universal stress protein [Noviherbaspirillum pedocola]MBK4738602.1 universal stress protein [Noviherbaspirillum pedocola]